MDTVATQSIAWSVTLGGVGLVALIFLYVIIQAGRPASAAETQRAAHKAHVFQAWFFAILAIGFVGGSWATLRHFPIPDQHAPLKADLVVDVQGFMWGWTIKPSTVKLGDTVEFRVSSKDVNHNFAIYNPDGNIVAQTQAMPGFTNKLLYRFTAPGTYTVQCLEYCGVGHGVMRTTIKVAAAAQEK